MLTFILTVTDSLGNTCIDSVNIRFSNFSYLSKNIKYQVTINQGDSTQLFSGIFGGIPPLSFLWTPDYNLSDNTAAEPWASPDTSTSYHVFVEDSAGCQTQPSWAYTVNVIPTSNQKINILNDFKLSPNPSSGNFIVEIPENTQGVSLTIANATGQIIKVIPLKKGQTTYQFAEKLPSGVYFVGIDSKKRTVVKKLIVD